MSAATVARGYDAMLTAVGTLIHRQGRPIGLKSHQVAPQSTKEFLRRLGIQEEVQKLNVIHVAGTKGKGSTCCFTESILRHSGCSTGLYTSPHLVDIRERIRLDGKPADEALFLEHFWWTFDTLEAAATEELQMPFFFEFMTLLALRIFTAQPPDVVILEVGIGGRIDATNVIDSPLACGVTALGFDHVEILGDTLEKIAWQKAGIMKPGIPSTTAPQEAGPMQTLEKNALEVGCGLRVAAPLDSFAPDGSSMELGLAGVHQRDNAAVAIQLARDFMRSAPVPPELKQSLQSIEAALSGSTIPGPVRDGLANARWPGRAQIIHDTEDDSSPAGGGVSFYLDGAHTQESITQCANWFGGLNPDSGTDTPEAQQPCYNVMLFYTMQKRDPVELLSPLHKTLLQKRCTINQALFVPLDSDVASLKPDAKFKAVDLAWEQKMGSVWEALKAVQPEPMNSESDSVGKLYMQLPSGSVAVPSQAATRTRTSAVPSLGSALEAVRNFSRQEPSVRVRVLVTGSLYLVGDVLKLLKKGM